MNFKDFIINEKVRKGSEDISKVKALIETSNNKKHFEKLKEFGLILVQ